MAQSEIDYYKILGLGRHATDDDIKRAFRKLARDTHPDKNPNDPTAKERFQDLHRAYDTLKDNLERSKYDNDNPYHGTDRASTAHRTPNGGARSGTAKRYTAGSSAHNTTPGWANGTGTTRNYDGFAQQAGSSRSKGWGGGYGPYEEWEPKAAPGYSYQTPRPPKAAPPPAADYEDPYGSYKTKRESAYARTSGTERAHPTSTKHNAYHSGAAPAPTPTPGGFNVADYIREKQAREEAERARGDAEEQRAKEQARLKREAEELKRQEEDRHKRAREAKERERRRAEEATRNPYAEGNGFSGGHSTPGPNGYAYGYPTEMPSPYTSRRDDEELLREAEERVKERGKTSGGGPHLNSHSRKTSRSSMRPKAEPTPSKWAKSHHTYGSHGIPEDWKHETTHHEDIDVVEATPTDNDAGKHDGPSTDYFNKFAPQTGPEYVRKDGTGVYPAPPLFNFNKPPAREKTPAREKPPAREKTPAQESRPERPRSAMPGSFQTRSETPTPPTRKSRSSGGGSADRSHEASRHDKQPEEEPKEEQQKQPPINVFSFEETAAPSPKKEKPAVPAYDFVFSPRPFDTFTSNSPEPKGEKAASTGSAPHLRPHSQPTQNHHSFVPPPSAPPNLQQQQQAAESSKSEGSKFNRELYDDLLKRTVFDFLPSGSKKKRSAPTLNKGRNMHRTTSKDSRRDSQPKAGSETESDEPKSATTATNPATSQPATGFGYEPMDAEPTGAPKTIPVPQNNRTKPIIPLANGMRKLNIGTKKGKATTSLDMSGMASVPPLSRSPADVGLGGFESLKESLPFPSQAATKPRVGDMRMKVPALNPTTNEPYVFSIPPDFWNLYPQTPLEQPFVVPKAPSVPKIPKQVSLDNYNRFYNSLGSYIEDWNKYEADVHALRAELTSKSLHVSSTELLDTQDIVKYMERVKNKDTILDQSFTKARDRHLASLDMWVKLRENVLKEVAHQEPH